MAIVTAQASHTVFRPCISKSRFLTGSSRKLIRDFSVKTIPSSSPISFKVEARKGEWLPGLASPGYLTGRELAGGIAGLIGAGWQPEVMIRSEITLPLLSEMNLRSDEKKGGEMAGSDDLPGDNGFDPLGLAEDPESLKWFVQAELVNGRWAMLGVAGMLLPEVFTKMGLIIAPEWYDAGKAEYFASSSTLFVIEFILFHYVEIRRWQDIKNPGSVNQDPIFKSYSLPPNEVGYPGGIFNPLNFAPTLETKEKEIANGRLAMLAFLGFVVQHNLTGKGPFENLLQHLSDPWHNTIIQALQGV
ncbi:hypothetical protein HHK36_007261 [Tetracentron sinense]|uniref:Chlorophyll a-b binding protein, chloroplastic n=1 Tax=Tetracentron sinense TaxID=13715 RepID=A0A835DLE6_TETSI|nr:hypothetical protein HHK36_007261 [Tetracentron sinense]